MSDFSIEINETNNALEVESAIGNLLELTTDTLILEPSLSDTVVNTLEIERSETASIQINTEYVGSVVFASDVIGLENFISNFMDDYEIDCGSP